MKVAQVKLFRRALIALIVVVIAAVGLNYVQTWRRRARVVSQAAKILSTGMLRSADSIEYSEHENGVMHFKLRAEKLLETRQGINLLEGIDAYDYNPDGSTRNHIRSKKAEYDREHRKAFFKGDVQIQTGTRVELRTESLHYDLEKNAGRTDDQLFLSSSEARGSAKGALYDHSQGILELQSNLNFVIQRKVSDSRGADQVENMRVRANRGSYSETTHGFKLLGNATIESESASLSGDDIEASFTADKKHITSLLCSGNAVYVAKDAGDTRTLRGDRMIFAISPTNKALERIDVPRNALFSSTSADSEQLLSSAELHLTMDPIKGIPTRLDAGGDITFKIKRPADQTLVQGQKLEAAFAAGTNLLDKMRVWDGARMSSQSGSEAPSDTLSAREIRMSFRSTNGKSTLAGLEAEQSVQWTSAPQKRAQGKPVQSGRELSSGFLKMTYAQSGDYLESGQATGGVVLSGIPLGNAGQTEIRRLKADRVSFQFYPTDNRLRSFDADDHVEVFYNKPNPQPADSPMQEFRTSSSKMRATFRETDGSAETARQSGNFVYRDGSRTATSVSSDYDAAKEIMSLQGSPKITDETATTTGEVVQYDRAHKQLLVRGGVRSVLRPHDPTQATPFSSAADAPSPNVVIADLMEYWTEDSRVRYSGSVQMLSEDSQLSAQSLELKDSGSQVDADGSVRHFLPARERAQSAQKPGAQKAPQAGGGKSKPGSKSSPILIQSGHLKYLKDQNSIHYTGNVTLQSDDVWMSANSLDAVLSGDGKNIEQATATGMLKMKQAGREVKGQSGDYYLNPGKFVVIGNPAEIMDPEKGKSAAPRLTFFTADDRILLGPQ